ncbi:MAG: sigma 54-interacting transcriptional regulator [Myxococcaceae bacterium]|nr:sigma 54-interacting transcriptional regulator [Myxococcaceae bacterium]
MATQSADRWWFSNVEPIGRERELALLQSEYDKARVTGRARVVLVHGPAGVGKSHLLGLFEKQLSVTGAAVLSAQPAPDAHPTAFSLFQPLLPALLEQLSNEGASSAVLGQAEVAARLGQPLGVEQCAQTFEAVADVFARVARSNPAFVFSDLDEADPGSLELLRYVLRVVATPGAEAGGLWVLSFREWEALPQALRQLLSHLPAATLLLSGLALEGVRSFLEQPQVAESLLALTDGNPARLGALFSPPVERPIGFSARRLERLDAGLKGVLEVLAVAGEPMTAAKVLAAAFDPPDAQRVASQLDVLVRERWLLRTEADDGALFRFLREDDCLLVLEGLPPAVVKALRRQVARACEAARDWAQAAALWFTLDDEQAGPAALKAAQDFESKGALEAASAHYRQAASVLSGQTLYGALEGWAQVEARLGRFRSAARLYLKLHRLAGDSTALFAAGNALLQLGRSRFVDMVLAFVPAKEARASRWAVLAGEAWLAQGDAARAMAVCAQAIEQADSAEDACGLRTVLGKSALLQGDDRQALRWFAQNAALAQANGLPQAWAQAQLNQGVAAQKLGDAEAAMAHYRQVPAQAGPTYSRARANLGSLCVEAGDFDAALEALTAALRAFARYETPRSMAQAASNLARLHMQLGDFERAQELVAYSEKLASSLSDAALLAQASLNAGSLALEQGAAERACEKLAQANVRFAAIGHHGYAALASALWARALLLTGQKAQAQAQLEVAMATETFGAATLEAQLLQAELALDTANLHAASRAMMRAREVMLSHPDIEGGYRLAFLMGRLKGLAGDEGAAQREFTRAGMLLGELLERVPVIHRTAFLAVPRRAQVWAWAHPVSPMPVVSKPVVAVVAPAVVPQPKVEHGLLGNAPGIAQVVAQLPALGRSNATVLIRGESGTGKEVLAQALHAYSPRFAQALVKVNCAAMVEELLLSELFGHEKGAFTGAVRERKGRFELADGGTLFLDEIGDISPRCQVALLRVLQEREFERVGGTKTIQVDVRIICATHRDLEALIARGQFRQDLYYRLKGVMVKLPSLAERIADVPLLAEHFLMRSAKEKGQPAKRLSDAALALLLKHRWPGNVRELENVLAAAVIFSDGPTIEPEALMHVDELKALARSSVSAKKEVVIESDELPAEAPLDFYELAKRRGLSMKQLREEMETQCIARALVESKGNISEAARKLGMKRSRLSQIINADPTLKEIARGQA